MSPRGRPTHGVDPAGFDAYEVGTRVMVLHSAEAGWLDARVSEVAEDSVVVSGSFRRQPWNRRFKWADVSGDTFLLHSPAKQTTEEAEQRGAKKRQRERSLCYAESDYFFCSGDQWKSPLDEGRPWHRIEHVPLQRKAGLPNRTSHQAEAALRRLEAAHGSLQAAWDSGWRWEAVVRKSGDGHEHMWWAPEVGQHTRAGILHP